MDTDVHVIYIYINEGGCPCGRWVPRRQGPSGTFNLAIGKTEMFAGGYCIHKQYFGVVSYWEQASKRPYGSSVGSKPARSSVFISVY